MKHKAQKKWGQNFIKDRTIVSAIAAAIPVDKDAIYMEIGPGKGALTQALVKLGIPLIAYEIDPALEGSLKAQFSQNEQFHLVMGDFLNQDPEADVKTIFHAPKPVHVVANLPYYITTPIMWKVLSLKSVKSITIMVQEEVAQRITASPGHKEYGSLTVLSQYYATCEYLFPVPRTAFLPEPNVDSAVIQLSIHAGRSLNRDEEASFETFVRQCFALKRKTLSNNLQNMTPLAKEILDPFLAEREINPKVRAEALDLNDFVELFQKFK